MPEKATGRQPANPNPDWQDRDIGLRGVVLALVIVAVVTMVAFVAMKALFNVYDRADRARAEKVPARATVRELPPGPLLQVAPRDDLAAYQESQRDLLAKYEWIDTETGVARIPIDRAVAILAEQGLPARREEGENE